MYLPRPLDGLGPGLVRGDHHADGDGQVVGWPRLADFGRGQVEGDPLAGKHHPRVSYGRADTLTGMAYPN